jgi:hypothetical protein
MSRLILFILALGLQACAPNLAYLAEPVAVSPNTSLYLVDSAAHFSPAQQRQLQQFYATQLQEFSTYHIALQFTPHWEQQIWSPWYAGYLLLGPLWPAQPRLVQVQLQLHARISAPDGRTYNMVFVESETLRDQLFWYGLWRNQPVRTAVDLMHHKLAAQLVQHLRQWQQPADRTIHSAALGF